MTDVTYESCGSGPVEAISTDESPMPRAGLRAIWTALRDLATGSIVPTVVTAFGAFALYALQGVILARMLGPAARGEYGTAVLYTYALMSIGMLGTSFSVTRRAAREPAMREALTRSALRVGALTGLGTLATVAVLAITALPPDKSFMWPLCIACALMLPFEHMRVQLFAVDRGTGQFRAYNANQFATAAIFPMLLLVAWWAGTTAVWVVVALSLIAPVIGLVWRWRTEPTKALLTGPRSPGAATLLKEGRPYVLSVVSSDLFGRLDAILFLWLASFTAQGYYSAAVAAASMLLIAPNALAMFTFNSGASDGTPLTTGKLVRLGAALAALQIGIALVFAAVLHPLMVLVYGSAFVGAVPLALALLPAQAANGFGQVADGYLRGCGNVAIGIWARCIAAIAMLAIAMLLYDRYQVLAIPIAASIAHICVAVVLAWATVAHRRRADGGVVS